MAVLSLLHLLAEETTHKLSHLYMPHSSCLKWKDGVPTAQPQRGLQ